MKLISLLGAIVLLSTGCAKQMTKHQAYPGMYEEKPEAVLVIPAINKSTAADAPILYSSTINEPLSNAGFYVLPIEVTNRILQNEGLSNGDALKNIPPQKFAEHFGADAVLYVTINQWDTNYYVIGGNVQVGVDFQMKSCKTGANLWTYSNLLTIDTSGDANSGGLLGAIIATAIATAGQDYVPIASRLNTIALTAIPFGKYHKMHEHDKSMIVNVSEK